MIIFVSTEGPIDAAWLNQRRLYDPSCSTLNEVFDDRAKSMRSISVINKNMSKKETFSGKFVVNINTLFLMRTIYRQP